MCGGGGGGGFAVGIQKPCPYVSIIVVFRYTYVLRIRRNGNGYQRAILEVFTDCHYIVAGCSGILANDSLFGRFDGGFYYLCVVEKAGFLFD